jgi:capsular exopolysaccharide synthesis family protein
VSLLHPTSFLAEPYRALRHLVEQLHRKAQVSIVAVSSAGVGDGKTTTAINLAGALAQAPDSRVLLVDADLRRSSIAGHLAFDSVGSHGLVEAILDPSLILEDVVSPRPPFNLDVLPAGILPPAPYEILKSPRLGDLLAEARRRYDYVVLDTAPLVPVPDSQLIGKWVDGFLLVVAAHKTPRNLVAEALNLLDPAKLIGLVFNEDDRSLSGYDYPTYGASLNGDRPTWWGSLWRRPLASAPTKRVRRQRPWATKGLTP